jgi:hypothetical protein
MYGVDTVEGRAETGELNPTIRTSDPRAATINFSGEGTGAY